MSTQKLRWKQLDSIQREFAHGRFNPDQTAFDYQFQNAVGLLTIRANLPAATFPASPPTVEIVQLLPHSGGAYEEVEHSGGWLRGGKVLEQQAILGTVGPWNPRSVDGASRMLQAVVAELTHRPPTPKIQSGYPQPYQHQQPPAQLQGLLPSYSDLEPAPAPALPQNNYTPFPGEYGFGQPPPQPQHHEQQYHEQQYHQQQQPGAGLGSTPGVLGSAWSQHEQPPQQSQHQPQPQHQPQHQHQQPQQHQQQPAHLPQDSRAERNTTAPSMALPNGVSTAAASAAAAAAGSAADTDWEEHKTETGETYYFNRATLTSSWVSPWPQSAPPPPPLPPVGVGGGGSGGVSVLPSYDALPTYDVVVDSALETQSMGAASLVGGGSGQSMGGAPAKIAGAPPLPVLGNGAFERRLEMAVDQMDVEALRGLLVPNIGNGRIEMLMAEHRSPGLTRALSQPAEEGAPATILANESGGAVLDELNKGLADENHRLALRNLQSRPTLDKATRDVGQLRVQLSDATLMHTAAVDKVQAVTAGWNKAGALSRMRRESRRWEAEEQPRLEAEYEAAVEADAGGTKVALKRLLDARTRHFRLLSSMECLHRAKPIPGKGAAEHDKSMGGGVG